jgi:fascin 1
MRMCFLLLLLASSFFGFSSSPLSQWLGNRVKFIGANGKHVTVRSNGGLVANGNGSDPTSLFTLTIINRPEIVLRGQFGFVGVKGASGRVEVNRSHPVRLP